MPQDVPSRSIGELTYPDISKRLRASSILCLPIGSIEQHGPHLPLNTDVVLAEEFTRRIIARWGDTYDLWQLPTQAVSLAREHEWAPGTLSLSIEGMTRTHSRPGARNRAQPAGAQSCGHQRPRRQPRDTGGFGTGSARRFQAQCLHSASNHLGGHPCGFQNAGNPWREERNVDDAGGRAAFGTRRRNQETASRFRGRRRARDDPRSGGDVAVDDEREGHRRYAESSATQNLPRRNSASSFWRKSPTRQAAFSSSFWNASSFCAARHNAGCIAIVCPRGEPSAQSGCGRRPRLVACLCHRCARL